MIAETLFTTTLMNI